MVATDFAYDAGGNLVTQSNGLEFLYDHTGIFAVKHNGSTYFYRKDAQANIVALLDSTGTVVVKYVYDAWGKCKVLDASGTEMTDSTHIGILNPFRYRSYYYDTETGFYFLKTRYYDPEVGRFTAIDDLSYLDPDSINGLNLYAYCLNNPTNYVDPTGNAPWWSWLLSGLQLVGGIALCFVPGAQALGVALIVGGATSMASNIMSAAGMDGKAASIVTNVLSIAGGIALCFTPVASIGASMIGSGALGIAGGYVTEALVGSFTLGSAIGNVVGGFLGGQIYKGVSSLSAAKVQQSIGVPFDSNKFTQIGVDPNTLKISRSLNPEKLSIVKVRVKTSGMYGVIQVMRDGTIIDGNHRVAVAQLLKIGVDVILK